jgi:hypothetical protein
MIFLKSIENLTGDNIVNIREENGEVIFSIMYSSGTIRSITYSEILYALEGVHSYETRRNLAEVELKYFEFLSPEERKRQYHRSKMTKAREKELLKIIDDNEEIIKKYNHLSMFFDQLVERFKAGVWKRTGDVAISNLLNKHETLSQGTMLDLALPPNRSKYKHENVKRGVDALLEQMRNIDSSATLMRAKEKYAHLTNDNFKNVSRLYHFKGKKSKSQRVT